MAKALALLFGIVFLLIGILGFVPALAPNEQNLRGGLWTRRSPWLRRGQWVTAGLELQQHG